MEIQRLSAEEWQRLERLRLAALRDAPEAFGSTLADAQAHSEADWRQQLRELPTFVAVHRGADVGLVRGAVDDTDPSTAFLVSMWTAPHCRRQGTASRLIDTLVDWARSAGFSRLVLDVADDNAAAVALYARHGFEPTGVVGCLPPPRTHIREHRRALIL